MSQKERETEDKFLDKNLAKGYIVPSDSPYGFSTFIVPKKDSKEMQYIIDYRPLNAVTWKDVTPLPNLGQCIENLQEMELFSKFDIQWGYNNIHICSGDEWKVAFKTWRGLFEPKVMFFGLSNSPASFQRFMHAILEPLFKKYSYNSFTIHILGFNKDEKATIKNYMDDCGIGTKATPEGRQLHIAIIHDFFDILAKHGLHLKLSKSVFMQPQMDFLGVWISKKGTTIDPAKIAGLKDYLRTLINLRQARGFLGVAEYHRMFVPNFSTITASITRLTGKEIPFEWGPEQQEAQEKLITLITSAPILVKPDPSRQFELEVDASQIATGAILYQRDLPVKWPDGTEKPGPRWPIGFHSQKFTTTEQNYPIYDREFLAIMHGLRHWSYLLKGTETPVLVITDHTNLCYYRNLRKIGPCIAGYLLEREQYNIILEYKPGATNHADALSRCPDYKGDNPDNDDILVWPNEYFCEQHMTIWVFDSDSIADELNTKVFQAQKEYQLELKRWATAHNLTLDLQCRTTKLNKKIWMICFCSKCTENTFLFFHKI